MKQITLLILLVLPMMQSISAQDSSFYKRPIDGRPLKDFDYFDMKARHCKTAGWVLLSVGAAGAIGGGVAYVNSLGNTLLGDVYGAGIVMIVGAVLATGSVPLFIAAKHYNRRARQVSVSFDMQKGPLEMRPLMASGYFPAMSFKFRF